MDALRAADDGCRAAAPITASEQEALGRKVSKASSDERL
jgi:hypothetical protein